jgi:hypothetical protein
MKGGLLPGGNAMKAECRRATMDVCIEAQKLALQKSIYRWGFHSGTQRRKDGSTSNQESLKNAPRVYRA